MSSCQLTCSPTLPPPTAPFPASCLSLVLLSDVTLAPLVFTLQLGVRNLLPAFPPGPNNTVFRSCFLCVRVCLRSVYLNDNDAHVLIPACLIHCKRQTIVLRIE